MTKRDKLLRRFQLKPGDFARTELVGLMEGFGYRAASSGKTGGSRVRFVHDSYPPIILHRPHPSPSLKRYQLDQVEELLKSEGLI